MKTYLVLAAIAATVVPGAAIAREHNHGRHHAEARHHERAERAERHHVRRNAAYRTRSVYVAPVRNWRYRPVYVGYQLQPSFYGSRYYVGDYGAYHLRAPGRWHQWIRYGNDLLLVNIRTGRVLDVIHYAGW